MSPPVEIWLCSRTISTWYRISLLLDFPWKFQSNVYKDKAAPCSKSSTRTQHWRRGKLYLVQLILSNKQRLTFIEKLPNTRKCKQNNKLNWHWQRKHPTFQTLASYENETYKEASMHLPFFYPKRRYEITNRESTMNRRGYVACHSITWNKTRQIYSNNLIVI